MNDQERVQELSIKALREVGKKLAGVAKTVNDVCKAFANISEVLDPESGKKEAAIQRAQEVEWYDLTADTPQFSPVYYHDSGRFVTKVPPDPVFQRRFRRHNRTERH